MLRKTLLSLALCSLALPVAAKPENFAIDVDHTYPSLEFSHMGISLWRGKFNKTSGSIALDRAAKAGTVDIVVDTKSIDFGHDAMNEHAVGDGWLNTAKFPTMAYKGKLVFKGDAVDEVKGDLTLMGVTRPVTLKVLSFKCIQHPYYKREACGADAEGEIHRGEFGLTKGADGDAGKVKLKIQVEALKQ
ncbi:MAG TPA: YceI family protein [Verrucomicrobiae bacterium]|nr:YceI family protein [Verrucomicrobiae bacterium]